MDLDMGLGMSMNMNGLSLTNEKVALGIDVGGTGVKVGLVTKEGALVDSTSIATGELDPFWPNLYQVANVLLAKNKLTWEQVVGVGLGLPGLVDPQRGYLYMAPNLDWHDMDVQAEAEAVFPVPIMVENDANVAALAEYWLGSGRESTSFVMLTIGTGIGSGFILQGQIYRGTGVASEIGHMVVEPLGDQCCCGSHGCLETVAAAPAMLKNLRKLAQESGYEQAHATEAKDIFALAEAGDPLAKAVITTAGKYLGIGIANIINILAPQVIALGGGVSQGGQMLLQPLLKEAANRSLLAAWQQVQIVPAQLKNDAGMVGAGALFWLPRKY